MFDRRVKFVLLLLAVPAMVLAGRLFQLQVVDAGTYRGATTVLLSRDPHEFPFLRGSITDCAGRLLAYDAPAWSIAVQYGVMVDDPGVRRRMCKELGIRLADVTPERIAESWERIVQLTGKPMTELQPDIDRIVANVQRIHKRVSDQRGVDTTVSAEEEAHPVVTGLDQSQQVAAHVGLGEFPWIEVASAPDRVYKGGEALGHLIGQLARVTAKAIAEDPNAEDSLSRYTADDVFGVRGVEALGERWLRGRRGQIHKDRRGDELSPPIDPQNGNDVRLTIDMALQQTLYDRLREEFATSFPDSTGGCAVVLDIPTRRVLAMVSYPSIDPNNAAQVAGVNPDDPHRPFLFRAVREVYPPGSIVKPMMLAAALSDGTISRNDTFTCVGRLIPENTSQFGCDDRHGAIDPIGAIQKSCNVFFYHVGQKLGVPRENWWMQQFGLGLRSGTGLRDELSGRLTSLVSVGEARNIAIGQGQLGMTPVQAVNMIATVASGEYLPVTLWENDPEPRPAPVRLNVDAAAWQVVREGMYRVVNQEGGTAYRHGSLFDPGPYVLLGKTGTAKAEPPERYYTCTFPDGTVREILARNQTALLRQYPPERRPTITGERRLAKYDGDHGWFVGYLARRDRYLQDVTEPASIAIAVVVEYAGHGGQVAFPVVTAMLDSVMAAGADTCRPGGS